LPVFKTGALNRSATPPEDVILPVFACARTIRDDRCPSAGRKLIIAPLHSDTSSMPSAVRASFPDSITNWAVNRSKTFKALLALVFVLWCLLWFGNLEYRDLVDPDEGRYAEIPREMVVSGDWVTPRLNDLKYFEKPPLQYWMTSALYTVFGVDEWVARLWPALAGMLGLLLTGIAARRLYGSAVGIAAPFVLGGTLLYAIFAHILTLDMTVSLFLALTIFAFVIAQDDGSTAAQRRTWMLVGWAAMAGAVLSKGLIGIVLPAGTVAAYVILHRDWSMLKRLHAGTGVVILALLTVPWFVVVAARNPEFNQFFFWHEHVDRFLRPDHHRPGPWWYFLGISAAGALPWTGALFARGLLKTDAGKRFRPTYLLLLWCVLVTAFFSASSSKLPGYILPIFPALAVLIALNALRMPPRALAVALAGLVPLVTAAALWLPAAARLKDRPGFSEYFTVFLPWMEATCAGLAIGLACGALLAWRRRPLAAILVVSVASFLAVTMGMTGEQAMSPVYSTEQSADTLLAQVPAARLPAPFYSVGTFEPSLAFALERPVTLVDYRGELGPGLDAEPHKGIPTLEAFKSVWISSTEAFAMMSHETYDELALDGLPMVVLIRDRRHVYVRRR
jgi:4-amino-4-deoxy-L-arabinose transferase-like glycosyltransferase